MDIFGLQKKLAATQCYEEVLALLKRELGNLGFQEWIYLFQIVELFQAPQVLCINTFQPQWLSNYMSNSYFNVDPLFKHFRSSIEPLFWSVEDDWRGLGPETMAFQEDMKRWGYWGGVCLPIQTKDATHGFVNLITSSHDKDVIDQAVKAAFLMRYVHSQMLRLWIKLHPGDTSLRARLTPREKEILMAVADGLTSQEIGERLHLSKRTVETHIASVQEKLQADNRQQALGKAINLGLMHPATTTYSYADMFWIM